MKLFITNQKEFKESFDREELRNSTRNSTRCVIEVGESCP